MYSKHIKKTIGESCSQKNKNKCRNDSQDEMKMSERNQENVWSETNESDTKWIRLEACKRGFHSALIRRW